jgi:hypothetical protein
MRLSLQADPNQNLSFVKTVSLLTSQPLTDFDDSFVFKYQSTGEHTDNKKPFSQVCREESYGIRSLRFSENLESANVTELVDLSDCLIPDLHRLFLAFETRTLTKMIKNVLW